MCFGIFVGIFFEPHWVGWTSGLLGFVLSMTLLSVIKYYMTFYRIDSQVKISVFFGTIAFAIWVICFIILVSTSISGESERLFWGVFVGLSIFYPVIVIGVVVMLRIKDKGTEGMTKVLKVLYVLAGICILATGVIPMLLWEWYSFGGGFVFIAMFVILHCFFPSKMKIILPIMTGLLVVYTLVVILI